MSYKITQDFLEAYQVVNKGLKNFHAIVYDMEDQKVISVSKDKLTKKLNEKPELKERFIYEEKVVIGLFTTQFSKKLQGSKGDQLMAVLKTRVQANQVFQLEESRPLTPPRTPSPKEAQAPSKTPSPPPPPPIAGPPLPPPPPGMSGSGNPRLMGALKNLGPKFVDTYRDLKQGDPKLQEAYQEGLKVYKAAEKLLKNTRSAQDTISTRIVDTQVLADRLANDSTRLLAYQEMNKQEKPCHVELTSSKTGKSATAYFYVGRENTLPKDVLVLGSNDDLIAAVSKGIGETWKEIRDNDREIQKMTKVLAEQLNRFAETSVGQSTQAVTIATHLEAKMEALKQAMDAYRSASQHEKLKKGKTYLGAMNKQMTAVKQQLVDVPRLLTKMEEDITKKEQACATLRAQQNRPAKPGPPPPSLSLTSVKPQENDLASLVDQAAGVMMKSGNLLGVLREFSADHR